MIKEWLTNTLVECRISLSIIFLSFWGLLFKRFMFQPLPQPPPLQPRVKPRHCFQRRCFQRIRWENPSRTSARPRHATDQLANIRILELGKLGTRFSWDVGFSRNSFIPQLLLMLLFPCEMSLKDLGCPIFFGGSQLSANSGRVAIPSPWY